MRRRGLSGRGKGSGRSRRRQGNGQAAKLPASVNGLEQKSASPLRLAGHNRVLVDHELSQTRHTLLQRLKDLGDDRSWTDFFDTYWRLIYTTAVRAGLTPEESQDVVQETILSVVKNIQKFKVGSEHGRFKAWLLTMTRWRIKDQFRKKLPAVANHAPFVDEDTNVTPIVEGVADPASLNMDDKWEADWQQNLMDSAIERVKARVDPLDYQMFDLHVLKLWPAAKVAALLNVKLGNVYFAKYKILGLIKKEVKKIETNLV